MSNSKPSRGSPGRKQKLAESIRILSSLHFGPKQRNETAAYTLLALLELRPEMTWLEAQAPLCGISPLIEFIAKAYGVRYAPNTRESIRDDAVKFFVDAGLVVRNPDDPSRPTNSMKTVYQIEPTALALLRKLGSNDWDTCLASYLANRESIRNQLSLNRQVARVPVSLPDGTNVELSPGGQNPLIKAVIEEFCPRFAPGGRVLYIGDTESKFVHLESEALAALGVALDSAAKIPDVIAHHVEKNWLLLIEAVTSAGPVDGKRRQELKALFAGCSAGLVFVTAFENHRKMQSFVAQIAWETEVWIADHPDHLIHFNGQRFLGPYPDVVPR